MTKALLYVGPSSATSRLRDGVIRHVQLTATLVGLPMAVALGWYIGSH